MKVYSQALILFAKVPQIGKVKTRLSPRLDQETVFQLYSQFLEDSIQKILSVSEVDRFIGVTPPEGLVFFKTMVDLKGVRLFAQEGKNLGEKMHHAFSRSFEEGYKKVVIIGSDSPSLPVPYIKQALHSDRKLVIGPSIDGGYYLIGMRDGISEVFENIEWGTADVLRHTLEHVKTGLIPLELLPLWYDVDLFEDLRFLKTHLEYMKYCGDDIPSSTQIFLSDLNID